MKKLFSTLCLLTLVTQAFAQFDDNKYNQIDPNGNISKRGQISPDSLGSNKEIPKGIKVWTIDSRFGDRTDAVPDTVSHMFMNSIFTTGLRGEYNALGNLGAPRINRIFIDRPRSALLQRAALVLSVLLQRAAPAHSTLLQRTAHLVCPPMLHVNRVISQSILEVAELCMFEINASMSVGSRVSLFVTV